MESLWPNDVAVVQKKAPVTILKEQASLLGQRTKTLVTAEVKAVDSEHYDFAFAFYIVGPALGNYRYKLFTVSHDVELYPVTIDLGDVEWASEVARGIQARVQAEIPGTSIQAGTEQEFLECLRRIFASQKTRKVIGAILAQSGVAPSEAA